jgi:hypothetical protein
MAIRARWRIGAALLFAWLASMGEAAAIEDTLEARRAAAEAFLAAVPVGAEVDALIEEISHDVASERHDWFVEQMGRRVDLSYIRRVMENGLTATLSTAELDAAAHFYSTPEGRAVRDKLPKVIDSIMPLIREELARTVRRLPH